MPEKPPPTPPPPTPAEVAKQATEFYNRTGMYRATDVRTLLGDPTQGVSVETTNRPVVIPQHSLWEYMDPAN